ncbi:MAG: ATP-binding protein [Spirochaetota bacterium]
MKVGTIDLRNTDLSHKGRIINLDGEWQFYRKDLLVDCLPQCGKSDLLRVPYHWNSKFAGIKQKKRNHASYYLKIRLPEKQHKLSLYLEQVSGDYSVFINREIFSLQQSFSKNSDSKPITIKKANIIDLPIANKELEIIIQVSNYQGSRGGITGSVYLGNSSKIKTKKQNTLRLNWLLMGLSFAFTVLFLLFFLLHRHYLSLAFACLSFFLLLQKLVLYDHYIFGQITKATLVSSEGILFFTSYLVFLGYAIYFRGFFQFSLNRIGQFFFLPSLVLAFSGLFLGMSYNIYFYIALQCLYATLSAYVIYLMQQRAFEDTEKWFSMAFFLLLVSFVSSTLNDFYFIQNDEISLFSSQLFLFINAFLVIANYNKGRELLQEPPEELQKTNLQLQQLDKLKDEFLANTTHELKTPLHGIIGITESILYSNSEPISEKTQRDLSLILTSSRRLAGLLNDILDYSKLKNRELNLQMEAIHVSSIVDIAISLLKPTIKNKDIQIHNRILNTINPVLADENRLEQILLNLIGNAIKFTHQGEVVIDAKEKGEFLQISIADTGIGIPKDKQKNIFNSFEQADSSIEREYGGAGLGLSISKKLVELQGGKISFQSKEDQGSTFQFTLRLAEQEAITPSFHEDKTIHKVEAYDELLENKQEIVSTSLPQILIVDDEAINLSVLENILSSKYQVVKATDGNEALEILGSTKVDLIILDVMMPGLNGYETCRLVRETYSVVDLPILLLTAKNRVEDVVTGFESGANDYIQKPFFREEVLARVNSHIHASHLGRHFSKYVPADYMTVLGKQSALELQLGEFTSGDMAVMFSDIMSFTNITEGMQGKALFDFVNFYFENMSPIIRKHGGTIVKYIGDGMVSIFWGDNAAKAVQAGIEKIQRLAELNEEKRKKGIATFDISLGIHFGKSLLGIIGEKYRLQGDIFSDNVNLAARVETLTRYYNSSIVVTEDVLKKVPEPNAFQVRFLDKVIVKGQSVPVILFEVLDSLPEEERQRKLQSKGLYKSALTSYFSQEFSSALREFKNICKQYPEDVLASIYEERCRELEKIGFQTDWDGSWKLKHK